jgi:predicted enzyme related to lactoylglutathione lyase
MAESRTYPPGVTCWIDTAQPDPAAARDFYAGLFGWDLAESGPRGSDYLIATVRGQEVAAVGRTTGGPATWNTYMAVADAGAAATAVRDAGGTVAEAPGDHGHGARVAVCRDPAGAEFRLWQALDRPGAQLVNAPGAWNFSDLHTPDPDAAMAFYRPVFGWVAAGLGQGAGTMLRVPGYGDHLASTVDPGIRRRQASAPPGFADVIGGVVVDERARWQVIFTVADRDASAAEAERRGATIVTSADTRWTRTASIRDPQGAEFTVSQFTPPAG